MLAYSHSTIQRVCAEASIEYGELATAASLDASTIFRILKGKTKPSHDAMLKITIGLDALLRPLGWTNLASDHEPPAAPPTGGIPAVPQRHSNGIPAAPHAAEIPA